MVKYRACLLFGWLIIGRISIIIYLVDYRRISAISIIIAGVVALLVYRLIIGILVRLVISIKK